MWKLVLSVLIGAGLGVLAIKELPKLNLNRNNVLYKVVGIRKPIVLGFAPYWLVNKDSPKYTDSMSDIAYFAVAINADGRVMQKTADGNEEPGWTKLKSQDLVNFRNKSSEVNYSLVVEDEDQDSIDQLITDPVNHAKKMMAEIIPLMKKYNFADLNLDIESLETVDDKAQSNFTAFVKTVREEMIKNKMGELSIDIPVKAFMKETIINPVQIQALVDYGVLMTYDYHYRSSMTAGPVAPVNGAGIDEEIDVKTAIETALKSFPSEKLVMGIPLYGYQWETIGQQSGAAILPGSGLTATLKSIKDLEKSCQNCQTNLDPVTMETNIIYADQQYGSYHQIFLGEEKSLAAKIKLAEDLKLGGVAFWALGYENEGYLKPLMEYKNYFWRR